ncbi:TetR-like C-terminal domain-containing protein [Streptacidiphilus sp. PAMC 29251]
MDEVGIDQFGMGLLAERLGIKTPSLYKHVTSQADVTHRIAVLAMTECADAIRDAIQGRAGPDALAAGAQAMRTFVKEHPGRYAAANAACPTGPEDPFIAASNRVVASWAAMLHGYRIDPSQKIHALRMLRTALHGFASLEVVGGFQFSTDIDDSFTWMIAFIDRGLRAIAATGTNSAQADGDG